MKEFFRKRMVALKRKPHMIPLVMLGLAFIYYSFNLSQISNTTALINGPGMCLAEFCTMLFSALSLVCFLNAFPYRKKIKLPMLILMLALVGAVIYCDYYYGSCIQNAITRAENRIIVTANNAYVGNSANMLRVHTIILLVGLSQISLPVFSKLLKIDTNVMIEGNSNMTQIDISGEDA